MQFCAKNSDKLSINIDHVYFLLVLNNHMNFYVRVEPFK